MKPHPKIAAAIAGVVLTSAFAVIVSRRVHRPNANVPTIATEGALGLQRVEHSPSAAPRSAQLQPSKLVLEATTAPPLQESQLDQAVAVQDLAARTAAILLLNVAIGAGVAASVITLWGTALPHWVFLAFTPIALAAFLGTLHCLLALYPPKPSPAGPSRSPTPSFIEDRLRAAIDLLGIGLLAGLILCIYNVILRAAPAVAVSTPLDIIVTLAGGLAIPTFAIGVRASGPIGVNLNSRFNERLTQLDKATHPLWLLFYIEALFVVILLTLWNAHFLLAESPLRRRVPEVLQIVQNTRVVLLITLTISLGIIVLVYCVLQPRVRGRDSLLNRTAMAAVIALGACAAVLVVTYLLLPS